MNVLFQVGKEIGELRAEIENLKKCNCAAKEKRREDVKPGTHSLTNISSGSSGHGSFVSHELDALRSGKQVGTKLDYRWYKWDSCDITPFRLANIVVTYYSDGSVTCEFAITSKGTSIQYAMCGPYSQGATWQVVPSNSAGPGSPLVSYFNFIWQCETNGEQRLIRSNFDPKLFSILGNQATGSIPTFDYCCCSFWGC
jgi:hypothetical protein